MPDATRGNIHSRFENDPSILYSDFLNLGCQKFCKSIVNPAKDETDGACLPAIIRLTFSDSRISFSYSRGYLRNSI